MTMEMCTLAAKSNTSLASIRIAAEKDFQHIRRLATLDMVVQNRGPTESIWFLKWTTSTRFLDEAQK